MHSLALRARRAGETGGGLRNSVAGASGSSACTRWRFGIVGLARHRRGRSICQNPLAHRLGRATAILKQSGFPGLPEGGTIPGGGHHADDHVDGSRS
jgi:hypothetical protein